VYGTLLGAEVVDFLTRHAIEGLDLGTLQLVSTSDAGDVLWVGGPERACMVYAYRLDSVPSHAAFVAQRFLLQSVGPASASAESGDGVERLWGVQETPELGILLAGTGPWEGRVIESEEEDAAVEPSDGPAEAVAMRALREGNIAEALRRAPRIAERARFVGMHGAVRVGYLPGSPPRPEYNVLADVEAARTVFAAHWDKTITPVDTCGTVVLRGEAYTRFAAHAQARPDSLAAAVLETYRLWLPAVGRNPERWRDRSTVLFDTVAVYLAFSEAGLEMETLNLAVRDDGLTAIDPAGDPVRIAAAWTDYAAFEALLVDRLCGGG
jgi:hypothetical protein